MKSISSRGRGDVQPRRVLYGVAVFLLLFVCNLFAIPAFAQDDERILSYESEIHVGQGGQLSVTETIKVRARGINIKRGIYRALPTKYKGNFMETVVISLDVTSVLRDGVHEPYFIEDAENGQVIYIGEEQRELPPGDYTYTIGYTMDRQVGFFGDYDEIYWNVTGSGWGFTMDSVKAIVYLPAGGKILKENISAYSGASGETGCDCKIFPLSDTSVAFKTTQPLYAYEGLTVAVPFEKGLIAPPSQDEVLERIMADNYPGMVALAGLCLVLIYYMLAWLFVGKDPRGQSIVPRFEPPANLAPYELRYISKMKFDKKTLVACIISMAQSGYLTITETNKGSYTLERIKNPSGTPRPVEKKILNHLFSKGSSVALTNSYNPSFEQATADLKGHLRKTFNNSAFRLNRPWITVGILASALAAVYSIIQHPIDGMVVGLFLLIWLSGWTFACYMLIKGFVNSLQEGQYVQGVFLFIFMIPFLGGEVFAGWMLASMLNFFAFAAILLLVLINILFFELLKAPTLHGRRLLDEIQGFSRFLVTAEMPRIQSLSTTPVMDLNLFQRYLPYALALDVQTQWAHHFERLLTAPEQTESIRWYTGRSYPGSLGEFSSSLSNTLTSTISSSSTRPGSSSGSSGGGSSGGGGGGGGGGGW